MEGNPKQVKDPFLVKIGRKPRVTRPGGKICKFGINGVKPGMAE
ncbi:Uncharacterized protein EbC_pEb17201000 (plasmid) [Erwinia billingiae Eb661]|uniref:Uncharacterized protein n=1 Tax=Erwinia billingiae (strain Eb661) TaxID=634500 RepID=D8MJV5_ERWBE|nr:Uncharacterized protein EbC_pEb17201000 [Erwinia billingiae Eb661]